MTKIYVRSGDCSRIILSTKEEATEYINNGYVLVALDRFGVENKWAAYPAFSSRENALNKLMQDSLQWMIIDSTITEMDIDDDFFIKRIKRRERRNLKWNKELKRIGFFCI